MNFSENSGAKMNLFKSSGVKPKFLEVQGPKCNFLKVAADDDVIDDVTADVSLLLRRTELTHLRGITPSSCSTHDPLRFTTCVLTRFSSKLSTEIQVAKGPVHMKRYSIEILKPFSAAALMALMFAVPLILYMNVLEPIKTTNTRDLQHLSHD
ncbi:hypothetical protein LXL04_010247 [Taraxacum kok-saghyz]